MTTFHDDILTTDPVLFVPWDAPGDSATVGVNLGSASNTMGQTVGGTRQAAPGAVAFDYEIALDGVNDYWSASTALFNALVSATSGATDGSTWGAWWRSTDFSVGPRYILRMDPWGMGLRRSVTTMTGEYYDTLSTLHQCSVSNTMITETGGGWQFSLFTIDPIEQAIIIYRNGHPQNTGGGTVNSTTARIRTSGSTSFVIGRNPSTGDASTWNGSIGPIFMWDRVLEPEEVLDVFLMGLGTPESSSIAPLRPPTGRMQPRILLRGAS